MFFKSIFIYQILNVFLITSCTLKDLEKDNDIAFNKSKKELKQLIIPKNITIPKKNKEYEIPDIEKDLEKENYNIFPPI